ncbi:complement C1q-like protein 2 [Mytilus californianus]|uniref:complement C1q-like protein 2 n=1 Tax=Mytilus californianus TaxID=6549 RepID=UPI002246B11F|nr:complement C1q-like protein 2 [Mytilus californianus]XP_052096352.1 complement C1q-like protein 2 [Mytilus californianus]XP_052096353.1 complement C1q-like protein 2 [Mytilus californianus]
MGLLVHIFVAIVALNLVGRAALQTNQSVLDQFPEFNSLKQNCENLKRSYQTIQSDLATVKSKLQSFSAPRPAFLAIWTADIVTLRSNDIIKFNHIVINVGNGYSPGTGKFKAPKQGTYFFGGTIVSAPSDPLSMMLMKSGTAIMVPYATGTQGDSYTFTAVLQLNAGDTVYVQNDNKPDKAYGRYHSTFSGFMI